MKLSLLDIFNLAKEFQRKTERSERCLNAHLFDAIRGGYLDLNVFLEYLEITQGDIVDTMACSLR